MGSPEASTGASTAHVRGALVRIMARVMAAVIAAATALGITMAPPARAQSSPSGSSATVSPDDRRQAAKDFAQGDRAFTLGDFREAAEAYERAYRRAPHYDVLWNEARAWHRAGELARAANAYAHYLREAPAGARDRNSAQKALGDLSGKLALLEIHAEAASSLTLDGAPFDGASVYVTPGAHVVEGRTQSGALMRQKPEVRAGDDVSVALVPPDPAPAPPPTPPAPTPAAPATEPPTSLRTWSPLVVVVGGAATVALAGVTVWSGLDTLAEKNTFNQNPTRQDVLASGQQRETRTNVLLAVTGGAGLLTAAAAIFFVDWNGHPKTVKSEPGPSAQLGIGPGSLVWRGTF